MENEKAPTACGAARASELISGQSEVPNIPVPAEELKAPRARKRSERLTAIACKPDREKRKIKVTGRRNCETLRALIATPQGISSLDRWAYGWRLSQYILKLREAGLDIETVRKTTGDIHYGVYILRDQVRILEPEAA